MAYVVRLISHANVERMIWTACPITSLLPSNSHTLGVFTSGFDKVHRMAWEHPVRPVLRLELYWHCNKISWANIVNAVLYVGTKSTLIN